MKKECIAMLLAGGQGSRLYSLTSRAAKPIMPFGGKYRIIDFPLSNCANSGINVVGVLTQYQPLQLNSYIGSGQPWDMDISRGGVYILPPYQSAGSKGEWFSGTANAIYQNIAFADLWEPEYVLILSGDHIYKMDYADMLEQHKEHGADCTIAVIQVPLEEASRFGIMSTDEKGFVTKFAEKPKEPESDLASMGIYIFTWQKLKKYLIEDEQNPQSEKDFGKNIIPNMLNSGEKLWAYSFNGYWRDVGTIDSLWESNMDMLAPALIDLYDRSWPIRSRSPIKPPHYIGENAEIRHSIVTEGCDIRGTVSNSVLSSGVSVGEGAVVNYSILMPGCEIGKNAIVEYSIIGENAVIGEGAAVGSPPNGMSDIKITTCGPDSAVNASARVEAGAMIYSDRRGK
ncbi:MAG: glucose-1-phosphate adenylyltransferase [Firmicutes bacterium HGW-Firmicutes-16]|nr:MAG: glucose-1-phosphate adenylyltransferase [Firmicutes bacterium HGW-Firmicutes-16]